MQGGCRPFRRFSAGPKCKGQVHQTTAPGSTRQVHQHWSESLGQGGTHLEKHRSIEAGKQGSIKAWKQGSREASYSGCSGSGVGAWWPLRPGLSHLTHHMGRQPFLWRHSDHQTTNQPINQARGQMHHFLPALSLSLMTVVKDWNTGSRRLAIIRDVEK